MTYASDVLVFGVQAAIDLEESLAAPVDTPANGSNGNASTETEANGSNGNESNGNESNGNGSNGNGSNGNGSNGNGSHLKHAEAEPTAAADGKAVVAEESKHDSEPEPELLLNQGSVGSTK